jgi:hypothetical protein
MASFIFSLTYLFILAATEVAIKIAKKKKVWRNRHLSFSKWFITR